MKIDNMEMIFDKLIADGDLRDGDHDEHYEVNQDDNLGFYQQACEYLLTKILKKGP